MAEMTDRKKITREEKRGRGKEKDRQREAEKKKAS